MIDCNKALSPKWGFTWSSLSEMTPYIIGSSLGDVTKTQNHLHRDENEYLRVVISRDDVLLFKVSSPEMTEQFSRSIISRDEGFNAFHGISSPESLVRDDYVYYEVSSPEMTERFSSVTSRDEGLLFTVSSPESLARDDNVYYEVSSREMMAFFSRYHLQNHWSEMTAYIMRYHL